MSEKTFCDRCGELIENARWFIQVLPEPQNNFDLCDKCLHEFLGFMSAKGHVTLLRKNPFPLRPDDNNKHLCG